MFQFLGQLTDLVRNWESSDTRVRWVYAVGALVFLALWLLPMWSRKRRPEPFGEQTDRFYVVSKDPGYTTFAAGSSLTEAFSPRTRVCLRFIPRREGYHSDDNDIFLFCSDDVYARLREGTYIRGTWLGEELVCFTEES